MKRNVAKLTEKVKKTALSSDLDMVGIAPAEPFTGYRWETLSMRDPKLSMPGARSLVIVGVCDLNKLKKPDDTKLKGKIAWSYASGHEFNLEDELLPIKAALEGLGYRAQISPGGLANSTIPLKLAAKRAGLGWQGKNSLIITPEHGSWVSFGGLMTDAPLEFDAPSYESRCGKCRACMDACPTEAIQDPYIVNMSLCFDEILNTPGHIPNEMREKIGNRILSCDICQEVCPYNKKTLQKRMLTGNIAYEYELLKLLDMDERQFVRTFGSFNWSIDFITFKRNVLIALGNSGDRSAFKEVKKFMNHGDKILSDVSLWAQKRINHTE